MKILIISILSILSLPVALAERCIGESECESQLLRVQVSNQVLDTQVAQQSALETLRTLASSEWLRTKIIRPFTIKELAFPHNREICQREKSENDPDYQNVNCEAMNLCSDPQLNPKVKERICFSLPCPLFEGVLQVGKCNGNPISYASKIGFPEPLEIKNIKLTPQEIRFDNGKGSLCFKVEDLKLSIGAELEFNFEGTQLPQGPLRVLGIELNQDRPQDICVTADIDISSNTPVTNIQIQTQGNAPFVSDQMLRSISQGLRIEGLAGYPEDSVAQIQSEVLPALFHPIRVGVEDAVKGALSDVFEEEIAREAATLRPSSGNRSVFVNTNNLLSSVGVGNSLFSKQLAMVECTQMRLANMTVPVNHECVGQNLSDGTTPYDPNTNIENTFEWSELLDLSKKLNITSPALLERVRNLRSLIESQDQELYDDVTYRSSEREELPTGTKTLFNNSRKDRIYREFFNPIVQNLENGLAARSIDNFVELQDELSEGMRGIGISLPEICNASHPPSFEGRQMNNCPIQAYMDLEEMNQLFRAGWESGQMCLYGRGRMRSDASQREIERGEAGGCYLKFDKLGCYLKSPPRLRYDSRTRKYQADVELEKCYFPPIIPILDIAKFQADFNISVGFLPKGCEGGDICFSDSTADWSVVEGTATGWLQPGVMGREAIIKKLNSSIQDAVGQTLRIPIGEATQRAAGVGIKSTGQFDVGNGFLGACFEVDNSEE